MKGFSRSPSMLVRTKAPKPPPTTPPSANGTNSFQFTFLLTVCDPAEAAVVKTSAAWTLADAVAGGTPNDSSTVEEITP